MKPCLNPLNPRSSQAADTAACMTTGCVSKFAKGICALLPKSVFPVPRSRAGDVGELHPSSPSTHLDPPTARSRCHHRQTRKSRTRPCGSRSHSLRAHSCLRFLPYRTTVARGRCQSAHPPRRRQRPGCIAAQLDPQDHGSVPLSIPCLASPLGSNVRP